MKVSYLLGFQSAINCQSLYSTLVACLQMSRFHPFESTTGSQHDLSHQCYHDHAYKRGHFINNTYMYMNTHCGASASNSSKNNMHGLAECALNRKVSKIF